MKYLNKVKNVMKSIIFWMIVLLFLELSFRLSMQYSFNLENIINIVLYSLIIGTFFNFFLKSLNPNKSKLFIGLTLFLLGFLFSFQCVFFKIFKTYFTLSNLELRDQVKEFAGQAISKIIRNTVFILVFFIPFALFCIFHKKIKIERNSKADYIASASICLISIILFNVHISTTKSVVHGSYDLYYNTNIVALNYEKFGVLNAYRIDFCRYKFGFEEELAKETQGLDENLELVDDEDAENKVEYGYNVTGLDLDRPTANQEIQSINEYIRSDSPTQQNKYTGMFKDYNLIYITAESFYGAAVSEELTPTLYRLVNNGFVFENFYTPNILSTIGGEFQTLTGLFPNKETLSKWRTGSNYFPYGLAKAFGNLGYNTYAYHNNHYKFQDRDKYLKSQGFTNYLGVGNGLEKKINTRIWPESDDEMIEVTVPDYINSEQPFLAYYMTVSGHMDYDFDGNNVISLRHKDAVKDLNGTSAAKAYVATQVELDKALERLLNELEAAGKLDNTVIVMCADHYPYALTIKDINSISSTARDEVVEINHNNLVIWNSQLEKVTVTKACMACDVLPTVMNLFGVEYDSRLLTGKDILSTSGGLAIMENRSWVSDKGTYFSATGEFVPSGEESVSAEYIENVNNIVKNRINIAKWIIKNDYYNYLFN